MMTDPIADLLTRIRNSLRNRAESVSCPTLPKVAVGPKTRIVEQPSGGSSAQRAKTSGSTTRFVAPGKASSKAA